jgi:glutamine amidotransferase
MNIMIYDYGVGNILSIKNAFQRLAVQTYVSRSTNEIPNTDAIILPGVGSYRSACKMIDRAGLEKAYLDGKYLVGLCLGFQLMFEASEEGLGKGLGFFKGTVKKFPENVKIPHMGWDTIQITNQSKLVEGLPDVSWVYYAHSYYPSFSDEHHRRWVIAQTDYGVTFPSLVAKDNIVGVQFHPEKSGLAGETILRNIVNLMKR